MEYDFEFDFTTLSTNSEISDDEFCDVKKGNYHKFETFDDDPGILKSDILHDQFNISNIYFEYDDSDDDVIIVNPETVSNSLEICKTDKIDVNQNSDFVYVTNDGELSTIGKETRPLFVLRSHLRAKRTSFLNKLKNDKYSSIFRRKSKLLPRTQSVPKIVVYRTDPDFDDGYNIQMLIDNSDEESSNQKLYVSSKKKAMRKSI